MTSSPVRHRSIICSTDDLKALKAFLKQADADSHVVLITDGRRVGKACHLLLRSRYELHSLGFEYDLRTLTYSGRIVQKWVSRLCEHDVPISKLFCRSDLDLHIKSQTVLPVMTNL